MSEHLAEISRHVAPGAHCLMQVDGAGWHRPSNRLIVPENITLLTLPPYSPGLNPVENVWQYLRSNWLNQATSGTHPGTTLRTHPPLLL